MNEFKKYNLDTYTLPLWEGDTIYNETVMFVAENEAPLLYTPEKILSVLSYDLKTEYIEGEDFIVRDGKIVLTENTRIPSFTLEEYYPDPPIEGHSFASTVNGHKYIYYGEGITFFSKQIHVTYTHSESWKGFVPEKSDRFKKFIDKVSHGEDVTVLVYGDSISTGVCSSKIVDSEPYADSWGEMVVKKLKQHFNNDNIKYVNTAVGGMTTQWGLDNVKERAIDHHPDLVLLGFGMNDAALPVEDFAAIIKATVDEILKVKPDCCIGTISTMLPHFRLMGFYGNQYMQEEALLKMVRGYDTVDVIPVTSMHNAVLEHKRYYDMTGNNVNHPNDFLARIYAQVILKTILG